MTADGSTPASVSQARSPDDERRALAAEQALDDADRAASNEWSVLVRPRHSRKDYVRQILLDVAVVVVALLVIVVLS